MNNEQTVRYCKKCKKVLPSWYNSGICEACKNRRADGTKAAAKGTAGLLVLVSAIAGATKVVSEILKKLSNNQNNA